MLNVHVSLLHVHVRAATPCPCCMSILHAHAAIIIHDYAACPCCMPTLHFYAACPWCMSMLGVQAACLHCMYMLNIYGTLLKISLKMYCEIRKKRDSLRKASLAKKTLKLLRYLISLCGKYLWCDMSTKFLIKQEISQFFHKIFNFFASIWTQHRLQLIGSCPVERK